MPSGLNRNQLLQLARLGAKARLAELEEERKAIEALIGRGAGRATRRRASTAEPRTTANESAGRRRTMSSAARRAVSQRMKRYWAERRKAQSKAK